MMHGPNLAGTHVPPQLGQRRGVLSQLVPTVLAIPISQGPSSLDATMMPCMEALCARRRAIHRSAWKGNSRKFISAILHNSTLCGRRMAYFTTRAPNPKPYTLWYCIKMRSGAYPVVTKFQLPRTTICVGPALSGAPRPGTRAGLSSELVKRRWAVRSTRRDTRRGTRMLG